MSLESLRADINRIDKQLVRLLNERASLALMIGREKRKGDKPVSDPEREDEVLAHIRSVNEGPLRDEDAAAIYDRIIAVCRRIQMADDAEE